MLNGAEMGQELPISRPTTELYKKSQGHPGPKGVGLNGNGLCTPGLSSSSASLVTPRGKETGAQQARIPSGVFRQIHCRSNQ